MNFKMFLIIVFIILAAIFITQNITVVEVNLLFWRVSVSLALLIVINLLIGFLLGWFLNSYTAHKKTRRIKPVEKDLSEPGNDI